MESGIDLEAVRTRIATIKTTAMELEALGEDIPSICRNTARILASLKMLEIGFSDLEGIDAEPNEAIISGKTVLIVDDEPDVLETLEDILTMCDLSRASSYEEAAALLESQSFDMAILDIMGVQGYDLLDICTRKHITAVMLTANATTPEDVRASHAKGAAYYLPKEEMVNIVSFLAEILEAKAQGRDTWESWYTRLASFCERKFGPGWQSRDPKFWDKFPFY